MVDLISLISEKEKETMRKYISLALAQSNVDPDSFIGFNEWLKYWNKSKQTLYHVLGDNLRYEIPIDSNIFINSMDKYEMICIYNDNDILKDFIIKYIIDPCYHIVRKYTKYFYPDLDNNTDYWYRPVVPFEFFKTKDDIICELFVNEDGYSKRPIKITIPEKGTYSLNKGAKGFKQLKKFVSFFKDDIYEYSMKDIHYYYTEEECRNIIRNKNITDSKELFEIKLKEEMTKAENAASVCTNELKQSKMKLVFSIHPFDFMTMSDNNRWSSCMQWTDEGGCYNVGSIEMMNSNNVICVYLINTLDKDNNFCFKNKFHMNCEDSRYYRDTFSDDECRWNNKRWRTLFYVTKEILMSGKSYPNSKDNIKKFALEELCKLVNKNLGWTYEFGIEKYQDMLNFNICNYTNKMREYIYTDLNNELSNGRNKIIFRTNGMYNDMANANDYRYYCYRNKIKQKALVINVSGKCNCLVCNKQISYPLINSDFIEDYNDLYKPTNGVICENCYDEEYY